MEANGAVFLPAAGYRLQVIILNSHNSFGNYWSSTLENERRTSGLSFNSQIVYMGHSFDLRGSFSVRLVQDVRK